MLNKVFLSADADDDEEINNDSKDGNNEDNQDKDDHNNDNHKGGNNSFFQGGGDMVLDLLVLVLLYSHFKQIREGSTKKVAKCPLVVDKGLPGGLLPLQKFSYSHEGYFKLPAVTHSPPLNFIHFY